MLTKKTALEEVA